MPKRWFYSLKGERIGPVNESVISDLISKDILNNESLVWYEGLYDWIPIGQTKLRIITSKEQAIPKQKINNVLIWIIAFIPIIGILLQYFIVAIIKAAGGDPPKTDDFWLIFIILNTAFCSIDENVLRKAGHNTKKFGGWARYVIPVYIFKRCKALNQNFGCFILWIACLIFNVIFLDMMSRLDATHNPSNIKEINNFTVSPAIVNKNNIKSVSPGMSDTNEIENLFVRVEDTSQDYWQNGGSAKITKMELGRFTGIEDSEFIVSIEANVCHAAGYYKIWLIQKQDSKWIRRYRICSDDWAFFKSVIIDNNGRKSIRAVQNSLILDDYY